MRATAPPGVTIAATSLTALYDAPGSGGIGVLGEVAIGAIGALLILIVVFGSFLAVLPLILAGVSILATFLLIGVVTALTSVSQLVEYLVALVGLGIAIDYSLLVVTRWREERDRAERMTKRSLSPCPLPEGPWPSAASPSYWSSLVDPLTRPILTRTRLRRSAHSIGDSHCGTHSVAGLAFSVGSASRPQNSACPKAPFAQCRKAKSRVDGVVSSSHSSPCLRNRRRPDRSLHPARSSFRSSCGRSPTHFPGPRWIRRTRIERHST